MKRLIEKYRVLIYSGDLDGEYADKHDVKVSPGVCLACTHVDTRCMPWGRGI